MYVFGFGTPYIRDFTFFFVFDTILSGVGCVV